MAAGAFQPTPLKIAVSWPGPKEPPGCIPRGLATDYETMSRLQYTPAWCGQVPSGKGNSARSSVGHLIPDSAEAPTALCVGVGCLLRSNVRPTRLQTARPQ